MPSVPDGFVMPHGGPVSAWLALARCFRNNLAAALRTTRPIAAGIGPSSMDFIGALRLSTRGFDGFVASTGAPIATGWSDPVAGRELHPLRASAFLRRTYSCGICVCAPKASQTQGQSVPFIRDGKSL